jgi:hypothetical protein
MGFGFFFFFFFCMSNNNSLPMSKTQNINCVFLAGSGSVFEISSSFWILQHHEWNKIPISLQIGRVVLGRDISLGQK